AAALDRYLELLAHVELAAREAVQTGMTSAEAGAVYHPPPEMREWAVFADDYFARAIAAWMKELTTP
ncbi:MAG: hypothetical protein GWN71_25235, partial [Gammaproteobacteria bacterium]|nr:hypothetical protein [Gemmatimonadota bacterium]NIT96812.1 hypothetical protein [Actinomycetota bacterium]NIU76744.1 hypothetical protein [Gammaproteobacteria bacterium]NIV88508.1 hypothetical protein [Actinomycetota bacterium]NIX51795.1 hypothetical protein [Actinomycetota bacterium]